MIEMKSDLVLRNGFIYTVDNNHPWAQAVAIKDSQIVFVGSDTEATAYIDTSTTVINLDGKMVLPAFVDSHMHPASSAFLYNFQLSLFDVNGEDLVQAYLGTIRKFAAENPDESWIIGAGYLRSAFD